MKKVDYFIPRTSKNDGDLYVSVNGNRYVIKRGVKVSLPIEVKEVLEASERCSLEAFRFINSNEGF